MTNSEKKGKKHSCPIKVPIGTMNGETIVMKDSHFHLSAKVRIEDDGKFRLKGNDIFTQVLIPAAQIESGKEVEVETVYGMKPILKLLLIN